MAGKKIPVSQLGKVYLGRSVPGQPGTIRGEPVWEEYESTPYDGWRGPPSAQSLTPQQQIFEHEGVITGHTPTGTAEVPLGLGRKNRAKSFTEQPPG